MAFRHTVPVPLYVWVYSGVCYGTKTFSHPVSGFSWPTPLLNCLTISDRGIGWRSSLVAKPFSSRATYKRCSQMIEIISLSCSVINPHSTASYTLMVSIRCRELFFGMGQCRLILLRFICLTSRYWQTNHGSRPLPFSTIACRFQRVHSVC